jgi:hypothetical protein
MAKTAQGRALSKRVLSINTRGIEVEVDDGEIRLLIDCTVSFPHEALEIIEVWAREAAGFEEHEAAVFRDETGEFLGRKLDEKFLLNRLR